MHAMQMTTEEQRKAEQGAAQGAEQGAAQGAEQGAAREAEQAAAREAEQAAARERKARRQESLLAEARADGRVETWLYEDIGQWCARWVPRVGGEHDILEEGKTREEALGRLLKAYARYWRNASRERRAHRARCKSWGARFLRSWGWQGW